MNQEERTAGKVSGHFVFSCGNHFPKEVVEYQPLESLKTQQDKTLKFCTHIRNSSKFKRNSHPSELVLHEDGHN